MSKMISLRLTEIAEYSLNQIGGKNNSKIINQSIVMVGEMVSTLNEVVKDIDENKPIWKSDKERAEQYISILQAWEIITPEFYDKHCNSIYTYYKFK